MTKQRRTPARASRAPIASPAIRVGPPQPAPANRMASALVLIVFAVLFAALEWHSYSQESAVYDEPIHVTDGYVSLVRHDYRVDPEHPPLLRMLAAVPLAFMPGITLDTTAIDRARPDEWALTDLFQFAHRFMYVDNDADRLLYPARFMTVLLGIGLGVVLFLWARAWLGFPVAAITLGLYTIEPNLAAHAGLVTTDFGFTLFLVGAVYFLWRTGVRSSAGNVAGLLLFVALATIAKFSAVLLAPIVLLLLAVLVADRRISWRAAAALLGGMALCCWCAIWAIYGFRYAPSQTAGWLYHLQDTSIVQTRLPALAAVISWIDDRHLLPNVFSQGFLIGQAKAQARAAFLAGQYSTSGWWYYFPFAFLIKTPVAILVLAGLGTFACVRRWGTPGRTDVAFVVMPPVVYMGSALFAHLNIGLRHVLPVYPFVILLAALGTKELLAQRARGRALFAALAALGVLEFAWVYPHDLAFFNVLVGGPRHGGNYLVDSNLDWGQDLKGLKQWMDANGVSHINLSYFGFADPAYYHIDCTQLPGAPFFATPIEAPRLPGYVAVSVSNLAGVFFDEQQRDFYKPLRDRQPVADIGYSIRVYWVDRPWW